MYEAQKFHEESIRNLELFMALISSKAYEDAEELAQKEKDRMCDECLFVAERQWLKYLAIAQSLPCLIDNAYDVDKIDNAFVNYKKGLEMSKNALTQKPSIFEFEPQDK